MPSFKIINQRSKQAVIEYLNRLPEDGKRRDVTVTLHREKRSVPQNRLYRLWLGLISDETGHNADDLHEAFKTMFIGVKGVDVGGFEATIPLSTTGLDTMQFTGFLEKLEAFVTSELGIILPHPEDVFWSEFEQKYGAL